MIIILLLLVIGLYLLSRSVHTKTAFAALITLVVTVSFLMAISLISFFGGVGITVLVSLVVLALDETGILA